MSGSDGLPSVEGSPDSSTESRVPLFARIGEAVFQVAASAGELLVDRDLRRKAGSLVVTEAGKRIKDIQDGVATRASNIQKGLNEGPRQVQGLYTRIQKQYQVSRQEASLKARRDTPVDVQVGPFMWEDAPQELRSRLWIALLGNPCLIGDLVEERSLEKRLVGTAEGSSPARSSHGGSGPSSSDSLGPSSPFRDVQAGALARLRHSSSSESRDPEAAGDSGSAVADDRDSRSEQSPAGSQNLESTPQPAEERHTEGHEDGAFREPSDAARPTDVSGREAAAHVPEDEPPGQAQRQAEGQGGEAPEDAWEIVQAGSSLNDFRGTQLPAAQLQPGKRGAAMTLRERLLEAVCEVAWPISTVYPEGCRYDTLVQISVGQEEVEEVIQRDINRTFPEHPQFSFEQGQQELFRVLKAYSLHDLQVGYCQGMAFVTGVILMYVPEEPAFRLLTRLMDERGANLRLLYLPGLEGLKNYLRMFEWLMDRLLPDLREHLEEHGVVPVLYASQWFLTAFSCPFPTAFACRVLDAVLTENSGHVMLRAALAVVRACCPALMELHDFEDLVTYLKVEPVKWSQQKARAVLNEAIEGTVGSELLRAAAEAVTGGYDGSLSRRASVVKSEAPKADAPTEDRKPRLSKQGSKGPLAVPSRLPAAEATRAGDSGDAEAQRSGAPIDSEPSEDGELMIALDALWVGETTCEET